MTSVLTRMVARALLAPAFVVAAAILVKGYVDVGDGFAAGIVASLGVLLQYIAFGRAAVADGLPVHRASTVAFAGLGVAVAVLVLPFLAGGAPFEHWPPAGDKPVYIGSLELVTAVAFDVGVFLLVLGAAIAIIDAAAGAAEDSA